MLMFRAFQLLLPSASSAEAVYAYELLISSLRDACGGQLLPAKYDVEVPCATWEAWAQSANHASP
eukprot:10362127-Karenia_brevis.AAC.1